MSIPDLLGRIFSRQPMVSSDAVQNLKGMSADDLKKFKRLGIVTSDLAGDLEQTLQINFERFSLYGEIDKSLSHWMMGASAELYADVATNYSSLHRASVWITSKNKKYEQELTKMLSAVGVEERIFDWAWTTGCYGDMFLKVYAEAGVGVYAIADDDHPMNISRLDHQGRLAGFYRTPQGTLDGGQSQSLLPPWEYVHMRILGAKRKRSIYGNDAGTSNYSSSGISSIDTRRLSSSYGTSLLLNGLPSYKRLRLAEDSMLLSRMTRGVLRYIYKIRVDSGNIDAVNEIIDQYATILKRARSIDSSDDSPNFDQRMNQLSAIEDLILPVWGNSDDITIEKIGGDPNVRWIVDIEELRNQLASALRVPLPLLGGFIEDATGGMGSQSIEKLDIRFARSARRLQRSVKEGIARLCQIHLSYMGMDADTALFDINMSETSTAEEEQQKNSLDTATDVISKFMDMVDRMDIKDIDKPAIFKYLNQKILSFGDFDLNNFKVKASISEAVDEVSILPKLISNLDFTAYLPMPVKGSKVNEKWQSKFGETKIVAKDGAVKEDVGAA